MLFRAVAAAAPKQKVTAIGQKVRPAVAILAGAQFRSRLRHAARRGYAKDGVGHARRENDDTILAPCPAPPLASVTQCLWRSAAGVDLLQLEVREETDLVAVRRPEGIVGVLGAGQELCRRRTQPANVKHGFAFVV